MQTNQNILKGLPCYIYRHRKDDFSNGGISSAAQSVTLIGLGPNTEIFEPTPERPAVQLIKRQIGRQTYLHAQPLEQPKGMVGPMAGGTFIYSSDSRFPSDYPIALHDRYETQVEYDALSR